MAEIKTTVIRMGSEALEMVSRAVESAITSDVDLARQVIEDDDAIDKMERQTLRNTVLIVLKEQPVAEDLKRLVSVLGIVGEIEKVADDAVKLAKRSIKLTGHFPGELKLALTEMANMTKHVFSTALRLCSEYDPEIAKMVLEEEPDIDAKYVESRNRIFELIRQDPEETAHLVRTIEVFHALEHVGDHAVEITKRLQLHWGTVPLEQEEGPA